MSYKAVRQVLESGQPKGLCRLLKIVIAEHANDEGWSWPSFETIAKEAGVGVRHTQRIIIGLEIAGHIEIQRRNGRGNSNRYRITNSDQAASPFYPPKTATKSSHPFPKETVTKLSQENSDQAWSRNSDQAKSYEPSEPSGSQQKREVSGAVDGTPDPTSPAVWQQLRSGAGIAR
jgi:DNA-binding transcriptional regulator YhcF (GntR family)